MIKPVRSSQPFGRDDIAVWPEGFRATLGEVWNGCCAHRSDDYEIVRASNSERLTELGVTDGMEASDDGR